MIIQETGTSSAKNSVRKPDWAKVALKFDTALLSGFKSDNAASPNKNSIRAGLNMLFAGKDPREVLKAYDTPQIQDIIKASSQNGQIDIEALKSKLTTYLATPTTTAEYTAYLEHTGSVINEPFKNVPTPTYRKFEKRYP